LASILVIGAWTTVFVFGERPDPTLLSKEARAFVENEIDRLCKFNGNNCSPPVLSGKSRWIGSVRMGRNASVVDVQAYLSRHEWRYVGIGNYSLPTYCKSRYSFSYDLTSGALSVTIAVVEKSHVCFSAPQA
jgi:hypothetical protein